MARYILRRLLQAILTVAGVLLVTFILFRVVVAGDVAANHVNPKAGYQRREEFRRKHKLDLPLLINYTRQLQIVDNTTGPATLNVEDVDGSQAAEAMGLTLATKENKDSVIRLMGQRVDLLDDKTPLTDMTREVYQKVGNKSEKVKVPLLKPVKPKKPTPPAAPPAESAAGDVESNDPLGPLPPSEETPPVAPETPAVTPPVAPKPAVAPASPKSATPKTVAEPAMLFTLANEQTFRISLAGVTNCGQLIERINTAPGNTGQLHASVTELSFLNLFNTQLAWHMWYCVTFQGESFATKQPLLEIIRQRAKYSLALTVPALGISWLVAMIISMVVAFYRGRWPDHLGVFTAVLGMCIPYLAYMILGQWAMFQIEPVAAWGMGHWTNIYVPVTIAVIAGVGGSVRFYRTIFLNEFQQDYVRTARAKGVATHDIMFKHILRNCMLPILTSVVLAIPFLILGSLLQEQFFGIPGLGDLMLTSINTRDVPIITAMTFLTAIIYVVGLLITDLLYAVFDPRIRLK